MSSFLSIVVAILSVTATPAFAGSEGGNGGDPSKARESEIRELVQGELRDKVVQLMQSIDLKSISDDTVREELAELLKKDLLVDLKESRYFLSDSCKGSDQLPHSATAIPWQSGGGICIDAHRLATVEKASDSEIIALIVHECAHHFGIEDKENRINASLVQFLEIPASESHGSKPGPFDTEERANFTQPYVITVTASGSVPFDCTGSGVFYCSQEKERASQTALANASYQASSTCSAEGGRYDGAVTSSQISCSGWLSGTCSGSANFECVMSESAQAGDPGKRPDVPPAPIEPQNPPSSVREMEFVPIKSGSFVMGSSPIEKYRDSSETQHPVTLTHGFEVQSTTVTQAQYAQVMGDNPSHYKDKSDCPDTHGWMNGVEVCPNHPVEANFEQAIRFISKYNQANLGKGYVYRLPTEAEWEYAERAGTQTIYPFGIDPELASKFGWFSDHSGTGIDRPHDVATLSPNAFGLYDMVGNVPQWVQDWYDDLPGSADTDPQGPVSGRYRVVRGGSYDSCGRVQHASAVKFCYTFREPLARSAQRDGRLPGEWVDNVGFRLARSKPY